MRRREKEKGRAKEKGINRENKRDSVKTDNVRDLSREKKRETEGHILSYDVVCRRQIYNQLVALLDKYHLFFNYSIYVNK